jgi:hypothetical protein
MEMIPNCPNVVGSAKAVAWGKGAGTGMGFHSVTGGCKAACGAFLGHALFPLALVVAAGYLGYKVYKMSNCDCPGGHVKTSFAESVVNTD